MRHSLWVNRSQVGEYDNVNDHENRWVMQKTMIFGTALDRVKCGSDVEYICDLKKVLYVSNVS